MKYIITLIILFVLITNCKAQIIPVENYKSYNQDLEDGAYIKDVNNVLDKFIGTWKGTYNSKQYEFYIIEGTRSFSGITEDTLFLRYKITNNNGTTIENTLTLPNDSPYVMKNGYVDRDGGYVYSYIGKEVACGQNGGVFTQVYGTNNTKMKLFLQVEGEIYPKCTTGAAQQVLPTNWIDLIKQ